MKLTSRIFPFLSQCLCLRPWDSVEKVRRLSFPSPSPPSILFLPHRFALILTNFPLHYPLSSRRNFEVVNLKRNIEVENESGIGANPRGGNQQNPTREILKLFGSDASGDFICFSRLQHHIYLFDLACFGS